MNTDQFPVIDPSSMPLVSVESMNKTHQEELELINRLGIVLTGEPNLETVSQRLKEWVEHTRAHFERENRLMRENNFPAYPVHSDEHRRVLGRIEALQTQWLEQKQVKPLAEFIFEEWPGWFDMHVNSMDAVTAQFLSKQGVE